MNLRIYGETEKYADLRLLNSVYADGKKGVTLCFVNGTTGGIIAKILDINEDGTYSLHLDCPAAMEDFGFCLDTEGRIVRGEDV